MQAFAAIHIGHDSLEYAWTKCNDKFCLNICPRVDEIIIRPSSVLLDFQGKCVAFGYEAEKMYAKIEEEKKAEYFYIRKLQFLFQDEFSKRDLDKEALVSDLQNRNISALDVLAQTIDHLKTNCQEKLNDCASTINWLLIVPNTWNKQAKEFLPNAAESAGIDNANLKLVSESEAIWKSCQCFINTNFQLSSSLEWVKGNTCSHMVVVDDVIQGKTDWIIYELNDHGNMKMQYYSGDEDMEGKCFIKGLENVFEDIFGVNIIEHYRTKHPKDYSRLLSKFFKMCREVSDISENNKIQLPRSFMSFSTKFNREQRLLQIEDRAFTWKHSYMLLDFATCFTAGCTTIIQKMRQLSEKSNIKDARTIIMLGGFSEYPLLKEAIQKAFPSSIVRMNTHNISVVKGAVLKGHCSMNLMDSNEDEKETGQLKPKHPDTEKSKTWRENHRFDDKIQQKYLFSPPNEGTSKSKREMRIMKTEKCMDKRNHMFWRKEYMRNLDSFAQTQCGIHKKPEVFSDILFANKITLHDHNRQSFDDKNMPEDSQSEPMKNTNKAVPANEKNQNTDTDIGIDREKLSNSDIQNETKVEVARLVVEKLQLELELDEKKGFILKNENASALQEKLDKTTAIVKVLKMDNEVLRTEVKRLELELRKSEKEKKPEQTTFKEMTYDNRIPTYKQLQEVCNLIGPQSFFHLGAQLGLEHVELERLKGDHIYLKDAILQMLVEWKTKSKENATIAILQLAAKKDGNIDMVKFEDVFK